MTAPPQRFAEPQVSSHLYPHLGMTSMLVSESVARGEMPVDDDIRTPGGLRAASTGLLMELVAGEFARSFGLIVLSDMTIHLRDPGLDVDHLACEMHVVRAGRSRVIAEGQLTSIGDDRLIAYSTVSIAALGGKMVLNVETTTAMGHWSDPAHRTSDPTAPSPGPRPLILDAVGLTIRDEDDACELGRPHGGVGGPQGRLHGGAQQLMAEAAALAAATRSLGTDRVLTSDLSIRFIYPAIVGPFVAVPTVLSATGDDVLVRVELTDEGNNRLTSLSTLRIRLSK